MYAPIKLQKTKKLLGSLHPPPYYYDYIRRGIYQQGVKNWSDITSISREARDILVERLDRILSLQLIKSMKDKQVEKLLFETEDGHCIETVLMEFKSHRSICVSAQSGCSLNCKFCATGRMGLKKSLTSEEITDQVLFAIQQKKRPDSISFMGMGEPLVNPTLYEALFELTSKHYLGFSQRRISVSTVGIPCEIEKVTKEFPQVNLAFSLHTPFQSEREKLMPIAKLHSIPEIFAALNNHIKQTNRKVFIAYTMMEGCNTSKKHAEALVKLIEKQRNAQLFHINLIRYHPTPLITDFKKPKLESIKMFREILRENKIAHTLRQSFGTKIYAACGQLADLV